LKLSLDSQLIRVIIEPSKESRCMVFRPRISGAGLYHHIYAWGNERRPIFKAEKHYEQYLRLLGKCSADFKIDIIAYALMMWHIHLFIYDVNNRLSQFMLHLHGDYARFYNRDTKRVGHVFGERFNNRIVQPNNYGLWLSRYIHRQAVEAGLVSDPKDYPWTSYRVYLGLSKKNFVKPEIILSQFAGDNRAHLRYQEFVISEKDEPVDWRKTSPVIIGDDEFVKKIGGSEDIEGGEELNKGCIMEVVRKELQVDERLLLNPLGIEERRLRHKVFKILARQYRFSRSEIAHAFNISVMAVSKALKKT